MYEKILHWSEEVVSDGRLFFWICLLTLGYMLYNRFSYHPFDDPKAGYPYLILVYTIYFAWVEGIMKVIQKRAQKEQAEKDAAIAEVTNEVQRQSNVIHGLVKVNILMTKNLLELLKQNKEQNGNDKGNQK